MWRPLLNSVCGLLVSCFFLSGCISQTERERQGRAERYNAMLARLKPGATREELRRLFPAVGPMHPFTTPKYIASAELPLAPGPEVYSLDADFFIRVRYAYQRTPKRYFRRAQHSTASPDHLNQYGISTDAIDQILGLYPTWRIYPRAQDCLVNLPLQIYRWWRPQPAARENTVF